MLKLFRSFFTNPWTIIRIVIGYSLAAILQGLAFAVLILFLRDLLGDDPTRADAPLLLLIAFGVASFVVQVITAIYSNRVSTYDICGGSVARIGARVVRLPLGWFNSDSVGRISSAISTETDRLSHVAPNLLPQVISSMLTPMTVMAATLVIDWRLGLVMVVVVPAVACGWRWASKILEREQERTPKISARTASAVIEYSQLQPVLRAQGISGATWTPLAEALSDENDELNALQTAQGRPAVVFTAIAQAFFAAVLALGLSLVLGGELDASAYIAIALMAARFSTPLSQLVFYAAAMQEAMVAMKTIGAIVETPSLPEAAAPKEPIGTDIEVSGIRFGYTQGDLLFDGVSITAAQGRITALVGPSGCGKTTATKLVARFWDVDDGSIRVGGVDVRDMSTERLMAMTSMVFQDVYLFNTSIEENIRLSRPGATRTEVEEAVAESGLSSVIDALPEGLDTKVGEGGLRLSGGERQRVAIARAFLKDAPILLLDEITSALDAENESIVTDALAELSKGRTVVVIAHRLSTVMNADRVYVLSGREHGEPTRVVEQGTPTELAAAGGVYSF